MQSLSQLKLIPSRVQNMEEEQPVPLRYDPEVCGALQIHEHESDMNKVLRWNGRR